MKTAKTIRKTLWLLLSAPLLGLVAAPSHLAIAQGNPSQWSYGGADNPTLWGDLRSEV